MDLHALQQLVLPSAVGTVAIVWSCISGVQTVGTIRYADKEFEHPYKPWLGIWIHRPAANARRAS